MVFDQENPDHMEMIDWRSSRQRDSCTMYVIRVIATLLTVLNVCLFFDFVGASGTATWILGTMSGLFAWGYMEDRTVCSDLKYWAREIRNKDAS